jgi:F420-dependent oxidoreductase-like protein
MEKVEFGVWIPGQLITYPPPHTLFHALHYNLRELNFKDIREAALKADKLGYHSLWISDHFSWEHRREKLECLTILSALSSITENIRLGSLVLCYLYRHPGLLAKMSSILDMISNGRLELGIGACWNEVECQNFGIEFPTTKIRFEMLKESIEILKKLWIQEITTYNGKYYTIKNAYNEPKPLQKPHPPIMIGGSGEKQTLKLVAKYADKSNFGGTINTINRKMSILRRHCDKLGRDYDSIMKTTNLSVAISPTEEDYLIDMRSRYDAEGSPGSFDKWLKKAEDFYVSGNADECISKIERYVKLGIQLFIIRFGEYPKIDDMEYFAKKVIPKFK